MVASRRPGPYDGTHDLHARHGGGGGVSWDVDLIGGGVPEHTFATWNYTHNCNAMLVDMRARAAEYPDATWSAG